MKKTKLYFLLTALLFAGSAMAASPVTPTTVYTVGDATTLQKSWSSKGQSTNYFVSGDTVIFQAYVCYSSASSSGQTWLGYTNNGSDKATWSAMDCFKGAAAWFGDKTDNHKYAGTKTSRAYLFNVTNCVSVLFYGNPDDKDRSITANVYELGTDNKVATGATAVKTATITGKGAAVGKIEGLDGSKAYQIEVLGGDDKSNGQFYEIAFVKPQPLTDATLKSITINSEALEEFEPTTTTYNVELPIGTTEVPTVEATPTAGTCTITDATSLPGATTIEVTAKDGTTTQTYTINFTVATCAPAELVLIVDSIGAIIETEDLVAPTLANPHNLSVVYASSNEEVVTVDQKGALTKVGVGEAVITITAAKQTVEGIEYCEEEVSYKVTLTAHPIEGSTTIFEWAVASSPKAPTMDSTNLAADTCGTLTIGKSVVNRYFGGNKFTCQSGMYKLGNNDVAVEFATEGGFLAEDEITIVGQNGGTDNRGFEIGNASAKAADTKGNIKSTTQSDNSTIKTYTAVVDETIEGGVLRLFRLAGKTMYLKSIKVVRPCTVESRLVLDKTAIDVLDSEKTITAPNLNNPNELVVKYESSNTEVVAVDANTGALTKGTKTGMATITISWERQTINFVRYCAGELVYTVTVKSGATAVENTTVAAPATKVIRDGQLLIIREGKTYTAQGVQVQ